MARDAVVECRSGVPEDLGEADVARFAQMADRGPRRSDGCRGAGAGGGGRAVEAAGPVVVQEELLRLHGLVSIEDEGRSLEGPSVLVDVGRHRGDPVDAEVPRRHVLADALPERQQEPTEAGVDVTEHAGGRCRRGQLRDGIDDPERIAGARPHHHAGSVVDGRGHRRHVGPPVRTGGYAAVLDVEVLARLGEGGMRRVRGEQHRLRDAPLGPGVIAHGLDREEDRLGSATGEPARARAVHQRRPPGDHLGLHLGETGEGERVEGVLVQVLGGHRLVQPIELRIVGVVDEAERPPALPVGVTVTSGPDRRDHVVDGHGIGRKRRIRHGGDRTVRGRSPAANRS